MAIWQWILASYFGTGAVFSLFLFVAKVRKFDRFDNACCGRSYKGALIQALLLWPILVIAPKSPLRKPYDFLRQGNGWRADQLRRKAEFLSNPPPTGKIIRICPTTRFADDGHATFSFKRIDLLELVENKLFSVRHSYPEQDEHEMLHAWLRSDPTPPMDFVDVPEHLRRIPDFVDKLVRAGKGEAECSICRESIAAKEIVSLGPGAKPGWNFSELRCPEGHMLMSWPSVHYLFKK